MKDDFTLGLLLGRREAFGVMAGRCSAAEAVQMRDIRDQKLFLGRAASWEEFCPSHLNMSKDSANRIIRYLEEFGPAYFEVTQITRISPSTYRAIAPSIREQKLHYNGDAIALIPENAGKVAAAVSEMRKAIAGPAVEPAKPVEDPVLELEKSCSELVSQIESVIALRQQPAYVRAAILSLRDRLNYLEMTV